MNDMSKLEYTILDNLSDDLECPATICPEVQEEIRDASRQDVIDALCRLHESGLVALPDGTPLDREALIAEPEGNFDALYWFGLTASGCAAAIYSPSSVSASSMGETLNVDANS